MRRHMLCGFASVLADAHRLPSRAGPDEPNYQYPMMVIHCRDRPVNRSRYQLRSNARRIGAGADKRIVLQPDNASGWHEA
jgi:hypothetical protein